MYYLLVVLTVTIAYGLFVPKINIKNTRERRNYCYFVFFLLFFFSALRGSSVGIDTANRVLTFASIQRYGSAFSFIKEAEPLYTIMVWLFTRITSTTYLMEACFAAFILGIHIWFNYEYAQELPLSLALFIIFNYSATMNTTRQYLAISLFLVSLHYIIRKKLLLSVIIILIAAQFHTSAYLCLLFCVMALKRFKMSLKYFLLAIPTSVVTVLMYSPITELAMKLFPYYARHSKNAFFSTASGVSFFWLSIYFGMTVLIIMRYQQIARRVLSEEERESDNNAFGVFSIVFLVYVMSDVSAFFVKILYRIMRYFYIGFTLLLPEVTANLIRKDRGNLKALYCVFMILALVIAYYEFSSNKYRIFPYKFFWQ